MTPLDQLILLNPDRKETLGQKRMSLIGRKSQKSLPPENGSSKRSTFKSAPGTQGNSGGGSQNNELLLPKD